MSPSVWRVWIEIVGISDDAALALSPSVWRVWIEMYMRNEGGYGCRVTLRVEGVD